MNEKSPNSNRKKKISGNWSYFDDEKQKGGTAYVDKGRIKKTGAKMCLSRYYWRRFL